MRMKILIDNGHGEETPGKCSPDGRLKEYAWTREVARVVSRELSLRGFDAILITPENSDTPLNERVRKVNAWCNKLGSKNVLLVSIHNNAAGADGKWHNARGFSVYVGKNASDNSKRLARMFTDRATKMKLMGNRSVPKEKYWVGNFAIVRDTNCPAVLTENLFQDNKEDVAWLLSEQGKAAITELHVGAIVEYVNAMRR